MRMVFEPEQGGQSGRRDKPHVSPLAAVSAIGAASRDVGFPPERDRSRAAVAGLHVELCLVYEARHRANATSQRETAGNWPESSVARSHHVHETPAFAT